MTITRKQIALLHVAKSRLGLSDDTYRTALAQIAGVTCSTELDGPGFDAMMGLFQYLGFEPVKAQGQNYGARPGMASFAQIELIRALWREYTSRQAGEAELNKWLLRCFKVSSLRFLTAGAAPKAITALKAMKARASAA
ncbi:regulatory protein GemA [Paracoccus marinaquae]|uniref:Regulatory protein GemA n=1 Tax=Paracoccus marinaquae TaxID=2841926 RepID=A0ABS6ARY9_9RHOB|nr:regulatory protein GemA [Paracoccus marinaquae]MBU3032380.1 regulatory protein GemA [Paracoccus marinaquae]